MKTTKGMMEDFNFVEAKILRLDMTIKRSATQLKKRAFDGEFSRKRAEAYKTTAEADF
jgi:hypothetical protein